MRAARRGQLRQLDAGDWGHLMASSRSASRARPGPTRPPGRKRVRPARSGRTAGSTSRRGAGTAGRASPRGTARRTRRRGYRARRATRAAPPGFLAAALLRERVRGHVPMPAVPRIRPATRRAPLRPTPAPGPHATGRATPASTSPTPRRAP